MSVFFEHDLPSNMPLFDAEPLPQYEAGVLRHHKLTHVQDSDGTIIVTIQTTITNTVDSGRANKREAFPEFDDPLPDNTTSTTPEPTLYGNMDSRPVTPARSEPKTEQEGPEDVNKTNDDPNKELELELENPWTTVQIVEFDGREFIVIPRDIWCEIIEPSSPQTA